MFRTSFMAILCLGLLGGIGRGQDEGASVEGKWERRQKDGSGSALRIVKEHKDRQTILTQYNENGDVVHQHKSQFELRKTDEVRIFTYSNIDVTHGPNKGQKYAGPFSYAYRIEGDSFYEFLGVLLGDPRPPAVVTWTRVKGR